MDSWNPKVNRRKAVRFTVSWPAILTCHSEGPERSAEVKVSEISINGARLELQSLKIGPHHLALESESVRLTLKVGLNEVAFCAPVKVAWYSSGREKTSFDVGVMFLQSAEERRAVLEKVLPGAALESGHPPF